MASKPPKILTPAEAISRAGSQANLARLFTPVIRRQAVNEWLRYGQIPLKRVWQLAEIRPEWFK